MAFSHTKDALKYWDVAQIDDIYGLGSADFQFSQLR